MKICTVLPLLELCVVQLNKNFLNRHVCVGIYSQLSETTMPKVHATMQSSLVLNKQIVCAAPWKWEQHHFNSHLEVVQLSLLCENWSFLCVRSWYTASSIHILVNYLNRRDQKDSSLWWCMFMPLTIDDFWLRDTVLHHRVHNCFSFLKFLWYTQCINFISFPLWYKFSFNVSFYFFFLFIFRNRRADQVDPLKCGS